MNKRNYIFCCITLVVINLMIVFLLNKKEDKLKKKEKTTSLLINELKTFQTNMFKTSELLTSRSFKSRKIL
jgi:hypothetical protein